MLLFAMVGVHHRSDNKGEKKLVHFVGPLDVVKVCLLLVVGVVFWTALCEEFGDPNP